MVMGTIGALLSKAKWNGPFLKGSNLPSGDRVPSGKMVMFTPSFNTLTADSMLAIAASRFALSTGTNEASSMAFDNRGMRNNSFFTITDVRFGIDGTTIGGSRFDTWLHM